MSSSSPIAAMMRSGIKQHSHTLPSCSILSTSSLAKVTTCSSLSSSSYTTTTRKRSSTSVLQQRPLPNASLIISSSSSTVSSLLSSIPVRSFATLQDSSFLTGTNSGYVDQMYSAWKSDPSTVHKSWDAYFKTGQYISPDSLAQQPQLRQQQQQQQPPSGPSSGLDTGKVLQLVRAYQVRGHLQANIDPLGMLPPRPDHEQLELGTYGLSEADLDKTVDLTGLSADIKGFIEKGRGAVTLRQIHKRLQETYCGTIGYEYMHIPSVEKCNWIRERIETREKIVFSREAKLQILDRLTWADHFERFVQTKWNTAKRFGLEGAESFIPGMKALIGRSAELDVQNIVIGMPHRGRLNVLNSVVRKNTAQILAEFAGHLEDDPEAGSGDVKYHLGMSVSIPRRDDKKIHLSLMANPSHLEAVDPLVLGKVKAKQFYSEDKEMAHSMGLLLHGDAAFAGQGVVYESMGFMHLPEYRTGGTVHIVINNQVGFTTDPNQGRSTAYCTDLAKAFNLPVFHVNGDDPESVAWVCELAAEWRHRWKTDCIVDIVCYRKHGHNEIDEPFFTQPTMYERIKNMPSTLEQYQQKLKSEGIPEEEIKKVSDKVNNLLLKAFEESQKLEKYQHETLTDNWKGLKSPSEYSPPKITGVDVEVLRNIGLKTSRPPSGFHVHPRLATVYKAREKTILEGRNIDWGTAEALAFGSLLLEKHHVRLSGQDVERGTFSHRHAVLHDQVTNATYVPLNNIDPKNQAHCTITNSHLSEYGVLGFELGYSLDNPQGLVLWEAQFGDFFNTAQVIVDQFIASGEDKWDRQTGLVLLLPHGYEGAGAEHSSARIERFLQMSNEHPDVIPQEENPRQIQKSNWQILNCSTPANYFHALRRQICRNFRKPLVIFTPKSLLRAPNARSTLEDMGPDTKFLPVLGEVNEDIKQDPNNVERLIFCTGKVYYDIAAKRDEAKMKSLAIVRIEQLSPFPFHLVANEIRRYPNAEIVWTQEEPMNMGAYVYVKDRLLTVLKKLCERAGEEIKYIGRSPAASTAAGHQQQHNKEQALLIQQALKLGEETPEKQTPETAIYRKPQAPSVGDDSEVKQTKGQKLPTSTTEKTEKPTERPSTPGTEKPQPASSSPTSSPSTSSSAAGRPSPSRQQQQQRAAASSHRSH